ncbi:MAG: hypothetical protein V2I66_05100 [Halieaceae bacterium]|jgi:hypothetical protein|nr:hypothetical protein [Halieaceae bacterium]
MNTRALLSIPLLVAASAATLLSAGAARADLAPDAQAHRACLERIDSVSHREGLQLRDGDTYIAPQEAADRYRYYLNLESRGESPRAYRVECEARRNGKVTFFALEAGRWHYQAEAVEAVATR